MRRVEDNIGLLVVHWRPVKNDGWLMDDNNWSVHQKGWSVDDDVGSVYDRWCWMVDDTRSVENDLMIFVVDVSVMVVNVVHVLRWTHIVTTAVVVVHAESL